MINNIAKIKDRLIIKNLIKKYENEPGGESRSIMYRMRLAISHLGDLTQHNCINKEERDNLYKMIISKDIENLIVAESVIENLIQKLNDRT